ncbi:uncharacterized protein LOC113279062 [Papaver somniferum]|uniref:uncharacterized protein LOC113279062 n=1 Tax=Papaver somniferum TaxID=3469 RepID=UPI000E6FC944|nr:uncharacterized protein LOC113279062 [Papaver somniferum]
MKVADLLNGKLWTIPEELQHYLTAARLPEVSGGSDLLVWSSDIRGKFSTSVAVEKLRLREPWIHWPTFIWKHFLHPGIASNIWKLQQKNYVDDMVTRNQGYELASKCCICGEDQNNMDHTLLHCKFTLKIWSWMGSVFEFRNPKSFDDGCKAGQHKSPLIKEIWMTAACATMKELWFQKE